jgi:hypothetical protein
MLTENQIITVALSIFGGSGAGYGIFKLLIEKEINRVLDPVKHELERLIDMKQSKEVCLIHHHNLDKRLSSIEDKLDILISKK